VRFAVPLGLTGLNHIVVDLTFRDHTGSATTVNLRAYGKEGLLNRQPATIETRRDMVAGCSRRISCIQRTQSSMWTRVAASGSSRCCAHQPR